MNPWFHSIQNPKVITSTCCYSLYLFHFIVDGKVATMETVVNNNELITHRVHRHEPPVTAMPLNIIHQDEDLIILDKPASIPVSSCIFQ